MVAKPMTGSKPFNLEAAGLKPCFLCGWKRDTERGTCTNPDCWRADINPFSRGVIVRGMGITATEKALD